MADGVTIRVEGATEAAASIARYELRKRGALGRAVGKTLVQGQSHMRRTLSQPGRGRLYARGTVTHRASAPGQAPAVDTGQYRASWRHRSQGIGSANPGGALYTEQRRAPFLERGTRTMAARPHAGPVAEMMARDFRRNSVGALS